MGCHMYEQFAVSMELEIQFGNDSSSVQEDYFNEIKQVADFMNDHPDTRVEIGGHTSSPAAEEYNQILSERRAKEVAAILVSEFAIAEERVTSKGYGESRLKDQSDTEEAHRINRRIEAVIFGVEQKVVLRESHAMQ